MKRHILVYLLVITAISLISCNSHNKENDSEVRFQKSYKPSVLVLDTWMLASERSEVENPIEVKVPSTVLGALVKAGVYKDIYKAKNLSKINADQFLDKWTYSTQFQIEGYDDNKVQVLDFEGLNYRANVYVNEQLVADTTELFGVFRTFSYNISDHVTEGKNSVKVEIYPPRAGDFTIGFVDWAPVPQDKNMGIWRPVTVTQTDAIELKHTFVDSDVNTETLESADLTISTEVVNHSTLPQNGVLIGEVIGHTFKVPFELEANSVKKIIITPEEVASLHIENPKLWWPVNFGSPTMHQLSLQAMLGNEVSDQDIVNFGIRKFEEYFVGQQKKHKGYKINGKEILIKGGGWVDDLLLNNSTEYNQAQIDYTKDMGLNTIRFEGFWGTSQEIYDMCDQNGLMAMVGFSCQWEWHEYMGVDDFETCDDCVGGAIDKPDEIELVADYFNDMTKWLRNHPSIFLWTGGSDRLHVPELEKKYINTLREENPSGLFCGAAKSHVSEVTGPTGVKMYGPYDYVPPIYWYTDTLKGGAYGFNTETGPGPQPPVLSSLKKMIPEENLWPIDTVYWNYHSGRHAFNDMHRYLEPLEARYGIPDNIKDFAYIAQIQSYELMRPMFESFILNKPKATGVIQWMLNSAWPETYWQLYDYYLQPTGAYFGAKKANQPILIAYHYGDEGIYLANETYNKYSSLICRMKMYTKNGKVFHQEEKDVVSLEEYAVLKLIDKPKINLPSFYFCDLEVVNEKGEVISSNFYWVSKKKDVMDPDPDHSNWIYTPTIAHANYKSLNNLPQTEVVMSQEIVEIDDHLSISLKLANRSNKIAFGIALQLIDRQTNAAVAPVIWEDNYFSLTPGEEKIVKVSVDKSLIGDQGFKILGESLNTTFKEQ